MTEDCPILHDDIDSTRLSASIIVPFVVSLFPECETVAEFRSGAGVWLKEFLFAGKKACAYGAVPKNSENFGTVAEKYDLTICVDTAGHIPLAEADAFVAGVAASADVIIFSAAVPGQSEGRHCNEQWPAYWARKFEKNGFYCFDVLRPYFWRDNRIDFRYRQSLVLFLRKSVAKANEKLVQMPSFHGYPLLHPDMYAALAVQLARQSANTPELVAPLPVPPPIGVKAALKDALNRRISQKSLIRKCYRRLKKMF